jgi:hypothetical protein
MRKENNLVEAIYDNPQGLVLGGVADLIWIPTKISTGRSWGDFVRSEVPVQTRLRIAFEHLNRYLIVTFPGVGKPGSVEISYQAIDQAPKHLVAYSNRVQFEN